MPGMLSRLQYQALGSALRKFQTSAALKAYPQYGFRENLMHKREHAGASMKLMYGLFWFVSIPLLIGYGYACYLMEVEHKKHPRPKFVPYDFIYGNRERTLFWRDGTKNLFYHPINNATPDGYENPDPREEHHHDE